MKVRPYSADPDEPGYLRKRMVALKFFDALDGDPSVGNLNAVIDFILEHVEEPSDKEEAREELLDMTADDYAATLGEILTSPGEVDPEADGG
jgi:hypothetical protein